MPMLAADGAPQSGNSTIVGYLVLEPDRGQMATRYRRCESVFTTIDATCPVCQGVCEKVNVWQEILLFAARHNIVAHVVDSYPALAQHGGVAAVCRGPSPGSRQRQPRRAAPFRRR
jgi:hypothetical protein